MSGRRLGAGVGHALAGQPGIGKSTLLMQNRGGFGGQDQGASCRGEESPTRRRPGRLGWVASSHGFAAGYVYSADDIAATIAGGSYQAVIVTHSDGGGIGCGFSAGSGADYQTVHSCSPWRPK